MKHYNFNQLAHIAGQTPFYFYDKKIIEQKIKELQHTFPKLSIYYAIKANPMPEMVSYIAKTIDGFDVSSLKELQLALNSSKQKNICFAGPGKSYQELLASVYAGIVINVESNKELQQLIEIKKVTKISPKISLRINPDFSLKRSGVMMTGYASGFGIDEDQIPEMLKKLHQNQIQLNGFHIYSGSQNLNEQALIESHKHIFQLIDNLITAHQLQIQQLNIGGGFGIPYFKGEETLNTKPIADNLDQLISEMTEKHGKIEYILELGRYLVGEAGYYVTKVVDIKTSKNKKIIIVDGGLHHHLANSGNFGQVIRKNYPILLESMNKEKIPETNSINHKEVVDIYGPLCTPLDILAKDIELEEIQIDDLIIIKQSGAYGKSASPENFLSHPVCVELLL